MFFAAADFIIHLCSTLNYIALIALWFLRPPQIKLWKYNDCFRYTPVLPILFQTIGWGKNTHLPRLPLCLLPLAPGRLAGPPGRESTKNKTHACWSCSVTAERFVGTNRGLLPLVKAGTIMNPWVQRSSLQPSRYSFQHEAGTGESAESTPALLKQYPL